MPAIWLVRLDSYSGSSIGCRIPWLDLEPLKSRCFLPISYSDNVLEILKASTVGSPDNDNKRTDARVVSEVDVDPTLNLW